MRRAGSHPSLFVVLVAFGLPVYAQENAGPISDPPMAQKNQGDSGAVAGKPASASDPQNQHIQIFLYTIAANSKVALRKLGNESLMLCLKCESLRRIPATGAAESWPGGSGSAMWKRGGAEYTMENSSGGEAELLLVEMKDSYAFSQLRVPSSERDPLLVDKRNFRVVLENEHMRVLLLRLKPREGTEDSQFASRLEVALCNVTMDELIAGGKREEVTRSAGEATWKANEMKSFVNVGENPLEVLIVELKHPFCYKVKPETDPEDAMSKRYFEHVKEMIGRKWLKKMPHSARDGQTGLLKLNLKLQLDGTIAGDDIGFQTVFTSEELVEKAIAAVRDAEPFLPVPLSLGKPFMEIRMSFLYNLPVELQSGCR